MYNPPMSEPSPFAVVFKKLTISTLREEMKAPYQTVSAWKLRGSIPSDRWPALIAVAQKHGIDLSLELLHEWRAKSKKGDA
jgi:hypothetical protein